MALLATAFPILPGKTEEWREFVAELKGNRSRDFAESRRRAGVRERTFLQSTPMGDLVIVTIEGDDPAGAFQKVIEQDDEFTRWFNEQAKRLHGVDMTQPLPGPAPELVLNTEGE